MKKKTIRKSVSPLLALSMMLAALAGCSGKENPPSSGDASSKEISSASAPEAQDKVTIKFWKYQDENEQETLTKLVDKFNAESETTVVEFETFPWEQYVGEKLIANIAAAQARTCSGSAPAIF